MVATFDVLPGDALVSVPLSAALRVSPADDACPPLLRGVDIVPAHQWVLLPWYYKLALKLLLERELGAASTFAPYMAVQPSSMDDVPLTWPGHELQQLQYPYFIAKVAAQQQELETMWQTLAASLQHHGISCHDLTWALAVVRSRTFAAPRLDTPLRSLLQRLLLPTQLAAAAAAASLGAPAAAAVEGAGLVAAAAAVALALHAARSAQQHAMCPLIDFCNHSSAALSECELDLWEGSFRVVAREAAARGRQVHINYGQSSSDALLQLYGFVEGPPVGVGGRDEAAVREQDEEYVVTSVLTVPGVAAVAAGGEWGATLREVALTARGVRSADLPALLAAAAAASEHAAASPAAVQPSPAADGGAGREREVVPYASLPPGAAGLLLVACRGELLAMGSSLEQDGLLLHAWQRLPVAVADLAAVQREGQGARQRLEVLQRRWAQQQLELAERQQQLQQQLGLEGLAVACAGASEDHAVSAAAPAVVSVKGGHGDPASSQGQAAGSSSSGSSSGGDGVGRVGCSAGSGANASLAAELEHTAAEVGSLQSSLAGLEQRQQQLQAEGERLQQLLAGVRQVAVRYRRVKKQLLARIIQQLEARAMS